MAMFRQFRALVRKNFLVAVWRRPFGFFLLAYGLPVAITVVLLSIFRWFSGTSGAYGVSSPSPIRDFPSSVSKKILISRPESLASDVDDIIEKFTKPLDDKLVQIVKSASEISSICVADTKGISPCHAAVSFLDTPKTEDGNRIEGQYGEYEDKGDANRNHTWSYQVLYEPIKAGGIDPNSHDNNAESYMLPLQLALYHALMNTSEVPEVYAYSPDTKEQVERRAREVRAANVGGILGTPLFIALCLIIYRHATLITADRESGMPQLVDAMGGSGAVVARVLSWLLVFNVTTLPAFVLFGGIYGAIIYQSSPLGLLIGWQILTGLAVNSTCIFAASFFRGARVSSVYIVILYLLFGTVAQILGLSYPGPSVGTAYVLSFLFTSSNFVMFICNMSLWEEKGNPYNLSKIVYDSRGEVEGFPIPGSALLGFLILHILVFPGLAILVEKYRHGIDFKNRTLAKTPSEGVIVAETMDLHKSYEPSWLAKIFCCGKKRPVNAVNGVSLQGHKGQIMCLVGPNGSGKTTTLHMMAGFISPTSGRVNIDVPASHIGLCPQRNTLWGDLTVKEHVELWSQIKNSNETPKELDQLLVACDLTRKVNSKGKTLSVGQQRKLQLACMFVGGSSLCLIDECTSGLDPLSRRVIWDILLEQRTKRSIILTTHFLDEVDVLADHITILSKGLVKCHGASTQLKNIHGGGYRVLIPQTVAASVTGVDYEFLLHQDRAVYHVPDSRQAAKLSSKLSKQGIKDISIAGPQVDDVFLNVAEDHELDLFKRNSTASENKFEMTPGQTLPFGSQVWVLFKKRIIVLRRLWFPYLLVLLFPFLVTPALKNMLKNYDKPSCANPTSDPYISKPSFYYSKYCAEPRGYHCPQLALGPSSANDTLYQAMQANYSSIENVNSTYYYDWVVVQNDTKQFSDFVSTNLGNVTGGIYMGSEGQGPILAAPSGGNGGDILNLWAEMVTGQNIDISYGSLVQLEKPTGDSGIMYVVFFTLMQALYPTFFVLYPSLEKSRKVRSVQYTNGVRHAPLWLAYGLFDFIFVLIISLGVTGLMGSHMPWLKHIWIMFPILALYGLAAILLGYLISHLMNGSLKTFLSMAGLSALMFMISAFAFALGVQNAPVEKMEQVADTITFAANLFLPIANVFRAGMLNLNIMLVTCRDGKLMSPGSIYAYGGPILYLFLQVMVLFLLVVWLEGDIPMFRRNRGQKAQKDHELFTGLMSEGVATEQKRVEENEEDLLRILHVDKWFGKNHAVNNVTLGLPKNDVTALIGPNGAGKSTLVNIVQSELRPNNGRVLICGEDSRNRTAQKFLGICPQYDALDLMTTREQLSFYAEIKGIGNVKENVDFIMSKLGLTPHASTYASNLSGGNKRKLSLGIALMGTPPVIILDEPTSAMDAIAKRGFWQVIKDITPGRTVLLTTHSMEEADTLGTRAAIISEKLLAVGTTQELRERYSNVNYVSLLLSSAPHSSVEEMELVRDWVFDNVRGAKLERNMMGGQVQFTMPGRDEEGFSPVPKLVTLLEKRKKELGIEYYSVSGATLERVFLGVVRENFIEEDEQKARYQEGGGIMLKRLFKK